jgi:hypothetical protein
LEIDSASHLECIFGVFLNEHDRVVALWGCHPADYFPRATILSVSSSDYLSDHYYPGALSRRISTIDALEQGLSSEWLDKKTTHLWQIDSTEVPELEKGDYIISIDDQQPFLSCPNTRYYNKKHVTMVRKLFINNISVILSSF